MMAKMISISMGLGLVNRVIESMRGGKTVIHLALIPLLVVVSSVGWARQNTTITFASVGDIDKTFQRGVGDFDGNGSPFTPSNVTYSPRNKSMVLSIKKHIVHDPEGRERLTYSGAEVQLKPAFKQFNGRYEARMKASCTPGSVTGFFLFRYSPWQEIDIEILGKDPTRIQTSKVFNPGTDGSARNVPLYEPRTFDLGFNACQDFHNYAFEWEGRRIRFYVDGRLIDEREDRIPYREMNLRFNAWLSTYSDWAGPIDPEQLPGQVEIQSVSYPVDRAEALLAQMTLDEKIKLLGGNEFATFAIPRLGIPALKMTDGPAGVRWGRSTSFPSPISLASTFDPALAYDLAQAMGRETKANGRHMLLGPCVNIARVPVGGRVFESFGEDPYLAALLTKPWVRGVQDVGILASTKHFALNNFEANRFNINIEVDERALQEIYFPAFVSGVEAGSATIMASYNKVRGKWASENPYLMTDVLKNLWGFEGFVVSDWGATHSTVPAANAGLDLEMPNGQFFGQKLKEAVEDGSVSLALIDEKVRRILRQLDRFAVFDNPDPEKEGWFDESAHQALGLKVAQESLVLLKNQEALLPLNPKDKLKVAILGPNALIARTGGGGSAYVTPQYNLPPVEGFKKRLSAANSPIVVSAHEGVPAVVTWPADSRLFSDGTARDGVQPSAEAIELARSADVAIVFVGNNERLESEGFDRPTMDLPPGQNALIEAVASVNKKTIVVNYSGGPITMGPWLSKVKAFIQAWYPGQDGSYAVADLILGNINANGRLPMTFPYRFGDSPASANYSGGHEVTYRESFYVGYRFFDRFNSIPAFPFGHGLSYTDFEYSDIKVIVDQDNVNYPYVRVEAKITNTGKRAGAEVVQLYIGDQAPSIDKARRELKGTQRLHLQAGESKQVHFTLDKMAFAHYNIHTKNFEVNPSTYEVTLAHSSRDLRLSKSFALKHYSVVNGKAVAGTGQRPAIIHTSL